MHGGWGVDSDNLQSVFIITCCGFGEMTRFYNYITAKSGLKFLDTKELPAKINPVNNDPLFETPLDTLMSMGNSSPD